MSEINFFRVRATGRKYDHDQEKYVLTESNAWRYPDHNYVQVPVITEFIKSCNADELIINWEYRGSEYSRMFSKVFIDDSPIQILEAEVKEFLDQAKHVNTTE